MQSSDLSLFLQVKTWLRDSHFLFDYDSDHVHISAFEANISVQLHRSGNSVKLTELKENSAETAQPPLLTIHRDSEGYSVRPCVSNHHLWQVVRLGDEQAGMLMLGRDQVIQLGKVAFRVRDVQNGSEEPCEAVCCSEACEDKQDLEGFSEEKEGNECKVCHKSAKERGNPLLSCCKCKETAHHIHYRCLKPWVRSKVAIHRENCLTSYRWKALKCRVCRAELPFALNYQATALRLFDFDPVQAPYIVLESWEENPRAPKAVHVISLSEGRSIRLGRHGDCDICLHDITVSRCHAWIRFLEGEFWIEDNSSKFGTLVQVNAPLHVPDRGKVALQAGRSLVFLCQGPSELQQPGIRLITP